MSLKWFRGCAPRPRTRRTAARPWLGRPQLEALEARTLLDTFLVSLTADSGPGSLRQAILNANATPGTNSIVFNIGGGGVQTIAPASVLPAITNPVVIDGTTQPGFAGTPLIVLDGSLAGGTADGLQITAGSSTVKALAIGGFGGAAIRLQTAGANQIISNYLGTDATGTAARANTYGVYIDGPNNTVGGTAAGAGNLLSGNNYGILIDSGSSNNVQGNRIGTDATGTGALRNLAGVYITASGNTVGGTAAGAGNLVSGNTDRGIAISGGSGNLVQGNFIGTNAAGTTALANGDGVDISSANNTLGGTATGSGNLISGNTNYGVVIFGDSASGNLIQGNFIGTNAAGTTALANGIGVYVNHGPANTVGGTAAGAGNTISGNRNDGVAICGASGNLVQGNFIGTNPAGTTALANGYGVVIDSSAGNTVGGTATGSGNTISGNSSNGIDIANGSGNLIQGNRIGTNAAGTSALANVNGVVINSSAGNTVGGTAAGAGNTISGNSDVGVLLNGSGNLVQGSSIGTDAAGTTALANHYGVYITAAGNTVGGTVAGAGNLISGNNYGVIILGGTGSLVQGNFIGTNPAGTAALANVYGVVIESSAGNTVGGTATGSGNIISGNSSNGVWIESGSGNLVQGNLIGTDATGTAALPNSDEGVIIEGSNNTVGGTVVGAGNLISGNTHLGVWIASGSGNAVQGNRMGTNATGTAALANDTAVVINGPNNTVGGTAAGSGNLISGNTGINGYGVRIFADGNMVQGNSIGTDTTGATALANRYGVVITGSNNTVGGTAAGAGNTISGNTIEGVELTASSGNRIQGNRIGTDATGTVALPNGIGVYIIGASSNTVGGTMAGAGNLISGNTTYGIALTSADVSNLLQGNLIGTNAAGTAALANGTGVYIAGSNNTVGGTTPGTGNTIAFNASDGVLVDGGTGNGIVHNAIFGHGGLGIHLINGGNNLQPLPTLTAASSGGGTTTIQGMLQSFLPNAWNTLEFFADTVCNPSGFGEGERYLGTAKVKTDTTGNATFTVTFNVAVPPGQFVSATATTAINPGGNTSQFAACALVTAGPVLGRSPLGAGGSDKALGHGAWPLDPVMIRAAMADPALVVSSAAADLAGARPWRQPVVPDETRAITIAAMPEDRPKALGRVLWYKLANRNGLVDTNGEDVLNGAFNQE